MYASTILALLPAALVTVEPGPEDGCPSSAQVQAALERHAPRWIEPNVDDDPARQLVLHLVSAQPGQEISFSLMDSKGRVRLYRALTPAPGEKKRTCAALADTIAFVVDRYFDEVEMPALPAKAPTPPATPPPATPPPPPAPPSPPAPPPAPPPASPEPATPPPPPAQPQPPPPPPAPPVTSPPPTTPPPKSRPVPAPKPETSPEPDVARPLTPSARARSLALSGTVGMRIPGDVQDFGGVEFKLAFAADLIGFGRRGGTLSAELSAGILGVVTSDWGPESDPRKAAAVRPGADLALFAAWPIGRGRIYLGPLVAFDVIWLEASYGGRVQREIRTALAAGGRAGYQLAIRGRYFARLDVTGAIAILRQRLTAKSQPDVTIFSTPQAYTVLSLGMGVLF